MDTADFQMEEEMNVLGKQPQRFIISAQSVWNIW